MRRVVALVEGTVKRKKEKIGKGRVGLGIWVARQRKVIGKGGAAVDLRHPSKSIRQLDTMPGQAELLLGRL